MFLSYCQRFDGPLKTVYEAYAKLSHDELILFLKVRNLPTPGTDSELASRLAQHDFHTYHFPAASVEPQSSSDEDSEPRPCQVRTPDLPVELLAYIVDYLNDWPLSHALGLPTSHPTPVDWTNACRTDLAMLTGSIPDIRAADPATNPPTRLGTAAAIRFEYVHVLEFFLTQHRSLFLSIFKDDLIPITASKHGRTAVLAWWKHGFEQHPDLVHPPKSGSIAEAVDSASRNGKIASLDWWISSGLPFEYTEAALEQASARNRIAVLDWWKRQHSQNGLPLKIGRVMEMASNAGHVDVLEWWASSQLEYPLDRHILQRASTLGKIQVLNWWLGSGLQLIFDHEALIGATRHNRSEVLEWWDKSGLHIQYRMCDIEEALEEAMGGGDRARDWWKKKGVDFNADDKEWMKLQTLN
ncbi:hypothetical protein PISMIDRAFT_102630 [Pisolithus microcarpus 441]|uniref:Unplaced genomic scaffold scaffold_56, whole genome shotgun sequence n=1 Tax=Pisolithus microcarpus 441 TaxID=765257 RepID=A0A0C9ZRI3_9AGAM|nr:hypothetical protein PISMIDRAFT_102630 [Pisolithus microcarpus 441]